MARFFCSGITCDEWEKAITCDNNTTKNSQIAGSVFSRAGVYNRHQGTAAEKISAGKNTEETLCVGG